MPPLPVFLGAPIQGILARMRIGIDLGGTKIEGIALADDGATLARQRIPTPRSDYDAVLDAIVGLVRWLEEETGEQGSVGVGTPGAASPATGLFRNAASVSLDGHAAQPDLAVRLGREVRMANDANCFTLSEAVDGAGQGCGVVFGVILGTGCGGGVVVDGRIHTGPNAIAGEWAKNPLPWRRSGEETGEAVGAGPPGSIESWISGSGLARDHQRVTGALMEAAEIARRAADGDAHAEATLTRYEDRLARSLASVINILDPDAIVLGGGVSRIERLYANVPRLWQAHVHADQCVTPLHPPVHGDASGVRGAAWLW